VVMIRLARFGARKQPYYRIVAIEKDRARNGRSIEVVGTYNPRTNPATVDLKHDRIAYWRSVGAQFSTIVEKLVAKTPKPAPVAEPVQALAKLSAGLIASRPASKGRFLTPAGSQFTGLDDSNRHHPQFSRMLLLTTAGAC